MLSCVAKHEILKPAIPTYTIGDIKELMELQESCDILVFTFRDRYLLFSQEPFVEREVLIREIEFYFPWGEYPKSIERCLNDLQSN